MNNINAEFIQGAQGQLFRLMRTPASVRGHVFYLPPLFEQANQTRHMLTRSAINVYQHGLESIVIDYYGTGDSAGELNEVTLALWQQDIIAQLEEIKQRSTYPIILSVSLSAALLLSDAVLAKIDGLILVQAEFNGKRFVQQFKRLALAGELNSSASEKSSIKYDELAIAGYIMKQRLFDQLSQQNIEGLSSIHQPSCWLEWQGANSELSAARAKQYQMFQENLTHKNNNSTFYAVDDVKYWQSTELEVAAEYLLEEQQALVRLLSAIAGVNAC